MFSVTLNPTPPNMLSQHWLLPLLRSRENNATRPAFSYPRWADSSKSGGSSNKESSVLVVSSDKLFLWNQITVLFFHCPDLVLAVSCVVFCVFSRSWRP